MRQAGRDLRHFPPVGWCLVVVALTVGVVTGVAFAPRSEQSPEREPPQTARIADLEKQLRQLRARNTDLKKQIAAAAEPANVPQIDVSGPEEARRRGIGVSLAAVAEKFSQRWKFRFEKLAQLNGVDRWLASSESVDHVLMDLRGPAHDLSRIEVLFLTTDDLIAAKNGFCTSDLLLTIKPYGPSWEILEWLKDALPEAVNGITKSTTYEHVEITVRQIEPKGFVIMTITPKVLPKDKR